MKFVSVQSAAKFAGSAASQHCKTHAGPPAGLQLGALRGRQRSDTSSTGMLNFCTRAWEHSTENKMTLVAREASAQHRRQRTGAVAGSNHRVEPPVDLVRTDLQGHGSGPHRGLWRKFEITNLAQVDGLAVQVAQRLRQQCMAPQTQS